jgi:hypothetical protein
MLEGMNGDARVLADGNKAPVLALGVWQVPDGPDEESVGRALRDSTAALEPAARTHRHGQVDAPGAHP